jgi:hypothetical protein
MRFAVEQRTENSCVGAIDIGSHTMKKPLKRGVAFLKINAEKP